MEPNSTTCATNAASTVEKENHSEAWGGVVWVPLSQGSPNSSATAPEAEIQWILNETQKYHLSVITVTTSTLD